MHLPRACTHARTAPRCTPRTVSERELTVFVHVCTWRKRFTPGARLTAAGCLRPGVRCVAHRLTQNRLAQNERRRIRLHGGQAHSMHGRLIFADDRYGVNGRKYPVCATNFCTIRPATSTGSCRHAPNGQAHWQHPPTAFASQLCYKYAGSHSHLDSTSSVLPHSSPLHPSDRTLHRPSPTP